MEQPPSGTDKALAEYLVRQLSKLQSQLDNGIIIEQLTSLPARPIIGKIYYFKNTIGDTITSIGYWGYKPVGWVLIA